MHTSRTDQTGTWKVLVTVRHGAGLKEFPKSYTDPWTWSGSLTGSWGLSTTSDWSLAGHYIFWAGVTSRKPMGKLSTDLRHYTLWGKMDSTETSPGKPWSQLTKLTKQNDINEPWEGCIRIQSCHTNLCYLKNWEMQRNRVSLDALSLSIQEKQWQLKLLWGGPNFELIWQRLQRSS